MLPPSPDKTTPDKTTQLQKKYCVKNSSSFTLNNIAYFRQMKLANPISPEIFGDACSEFFGVRKSYHPAQMPACDQCSPLRGVL
jgi:hypothetical protein